VSKEPNETLVMTTCKCRENTTNLVISRAYFTEMLENKIAWGAKLEQERIINLLMDLNAVRRCAATNKLVSFDLNGEKVIYLPGVEND